MSVVPFSLPQHSHVLIAGAGGGFDIVCGLPMAIELTSLGHTVSLASYSFTDLHKVSNAKWHLPNLLEVGAAAYSTEWYFPELHIARWYSSRNDNQSVYCFDKQGVIPTTDAYKFIVDANRIDTVICIDGGIDGLFRGDETDLGTPSMDSISILAAHLCGAKRRIYVATAFGVEGSEGKVSHAQALQRMSELVTQDAYLGTGSVVRSTPTGKQFASAIDYLFNKMPPQGKSTIVSSILAAMNGAFGRTSVNIKTEFKSPWLSPLTTLFWCFEADNVARMKLFYKDILQTTTVAQVGAAVDKARAQYGVSSYQGIPI